MSLIRILEVRPNPRLHIHNLRESILGYLPASIQLCESDSEAEVINILISDDVVIRCRNWRIDEEFEKSLACECPSLLVTVDKRFGICQGLGEGYDGSLAVEWSGEFLGVG